MSSNDGHSDETEEEAISAGMELSVAGNQIRPFVFFSGQGELMGHVWSGTASEMTPALQASYWYHYANIRSNNFWFTGFGFASRSIGVFAVGCWFYS